MFRKLWGSPAALKEDDDVSDGQLSDIDPSSSDDEDDGPSTSSSSSSSGKNHQPTAVKVEQPPNETGDQSANGKDASIVHLLRREFGPRGNLFSVNSQEYLDDRRRKRLVSKKGHVQIAQSRVSSRGRRYLSDFFNTMLDIKWRYVLIIFTASFFLSWLAFAVVWWLILVYRGDFEPDHLPDKQAENRWQPCVLAMYDFASVFLFSVETQHTIGYGSRQTTERCIEAIFMQSLQSVVGVMIQACMVGTIFAKLARPLKRTETLLFSKNAIVCSRDGVLCLLFRVANLRNSHLIETHVRALLISKKVTEEGEIIPFHQTELKVGVDMEGDEDTILFIWPTVVVHRIDEESPFYHMSAKDIYRKHYEVIVVLEGIVEPTGMSIQARSSYLGDEILWGYRFKNVLNFQDGCYRIDNSTFNQVEKVETVTCSAKQMEEMRKSRPPVIKGHHQGGVTRSKSAPAVKTVNHVSSLPSLHVRLIDSPGQLQKAVAMRQSPVFLPRRAPNYPYVPAVYPTARPSRSTPPSIMTHRRIP